MYYCDNEDRYLEPTEVTFDGDGWTCDHCGDEAVPYVDPIEFWFDYGDMKYDEQKCQP